MTGSWPRSLVAVSVAAVTIGSAPPLTAQWATERHRMLPDAAPSRMAHGDIDGDGDVDFVYLDGVSLYVVTNDGSGRFTRAANAIGQLQWAVPIALGDIDGDGDLDVAAGGFFHVFGGYLPARLFRNDGGGPWTDVSSQWGSVSEATTTLRFFDYDGDGDQDILTLDRVIGQLVPVQPINRLYLNDGSGVFTDVTATRMPAPMNGNTDVAVGDVDGDGDQDIVLTAARLNSGSGGSVRVLLQDASGVALEAPGLVPTTPTPYGGFWDVALIDFENDGDLDIVVASTNGLQFFVNAGAANFTLAQTSAEPSVFRLASADFDGDGLVDLLTTRRVHQRIWQPCQLYRNTGGGFVDATATRFELPEAAMGELFAFDVEQDGDVDVLFGSCPQPRLWHNDGQGHLLQLVADDLSRPFGVAALAADSDADGDVDVLVMERVDTVAGVYVSRNDGRGPTSVTTSILPAGLQNPVCMAWIDADLDGDLDVFVGSRGIVGLGTTPRDFLFHQVAGSFVDVSAGQLPGGGSSAGSGMPTVTVGDVDADGRPDLLSPYRIYRNVGPTGFVDVSSVLPVATSIIADDAWLDFDGDGDVDTVRASPNGPGPSLVFLANQWPAAFVDVTANHTLPPVVAAAVTPADVDGDGRCDLLVGGTGVAGVGNGIHVLRAVANGFVDETALRMPVITASVDRIDVIDLDGDGWPDVRYVTSSSSSSSPPPIVLHNVAGVFTASTPFAGLPLPLAGADFDGDGDVDLLSEAGILRNRTRDIQNAVPPRLGLPSQLVVHAYGGNGIDPQAVLLLLSPQLAAVPLVTPLGRLFLDPAQAIYHSGLVIAGSGGEAGIAYGVPSSPAMLGVTVFVQGVFVHEPAAATWRLGSPVELRVRL